jgi:RNA polymerase sigma factor (sigma-70 family)
MLVSAMGKHADSAVGRTCRPSLLLRSASHARQCPVRAAPRARGVPGEPPRRIHASLPPARPADRSALGTIGLIEAIDRYDPDRGVPLANFAYFRIKGAIIDEGRRQVGATLGSNLVSLHQTTVGDAGGEADLELVELSTDPTSPAPSVHMELSELLTAVSRLPSRERDIVALHVKGFTVAEIADLEGCSRSRASQLLMQAHLRLEEATAA